MDFLFRTLNLMETSDLLFFDAQCNAVVARKLQALDKKVWPTVSLDIYTHIVIFND